MIKLFHLNPLATGYFKKLIPLLGLILWFSLPVLSQKDSIFLQPNFLIEYDREPWYGPSGIKLKTKRYKNENYLRFFNNHFLYTGYSNSARIDRLAYFYNPINIQSGYIHQLSSDQSQQGDFYSKNANLTNGVTDTYSSSNENIIELKREQRKIHGYEYTFTHYREPHINTRNKKVTWTHYKIASLDTLFSDGTYLKVSAKTTRGSFNFLERRLNKLAQIRKVPTALPDSIQRSHFIEKNFIEALDSVYSGWRRRFIIYDKAQLSCTAPEFTHPLTMGKMSLEKVVSLLSDFKYDELTDSILQYHKDFLYQSGNQLLQLLDDYEYSMSKEANYYALMAQGKTNPDDYLNYLNHDSTMTFLDTLEMYDKIRNYTVYNLMRYMEQNDGLLFEQEISKRFTYRVESELCRQFSIQNLGYTDDVPLYHKLISDSKSRKIFLISDGDEFFSSPTIVILVRQNDKTWKSTYKELNFNPVIEGKSTMYPLQSYLIVPGLLQCLVLDNKMDLQILDMDTTNWGMYKQILFCNKSMTRAPLNLGLKFLSSYNSESGSHEIELQDDNYFEKEIQSSRSGYSSAPPIEFPARNYSLTPGETMLYQPFILADLNQQGSAEIITYTICAGECLQLKCYTADNGLLHEVERETALEWLQRNEQFLNLMNYSLVGNRNSLKITSK